MTQVVGVSKATVQRLWHSNDIKPHLTHIFKLSTDPHFEEKSRDVIGLYLNQPEKVLVLCRDEKGQCQALERTQPELPLGVGHIKTHPHDYYRNGTTTLFAVLNYLEGKMIGRTEARPTHVEWLLFLKQIDRGTPKELDIHLIADNYATHKSGSQDLDSEAFPFPHALPSDFRLLDESRRAILPRHQRRVYTPRKLQQHPGVGGRHPILSRRTHPKSHPLRLES